MVKELDYDNIVKTYHIVKNTMFSLPGYKTTAAEEQIMAYTTMNLYKNISNPNRCNLLYVDNYEVLGFLFANIEQHESKTVAYLEWNGIHPDVRQTGVMQKLWNRFELWSKEKRVDGILVDTLTTNTPMIKFLEKNNVSIIRQMNNHWYGLDYFLWGKFYG